MSVSIYVKTLVDRNLLYCRMFGQFKRVPVYIKLYFNRMEITNLETGETVSRTAEQPFSIPRAVLAKFNESEELARAILREMGLIRKYLSPTFKIVIQQMEKMEGGLTDIEKRAMRDLAEQAGGVTVRIIEHTQPLSEIEALNEAMERSN